MCFSGQTYPVQSSGDVFQGFHSRHLSSYASVSSFGQPQCLRIIDCLCRAPTTPLLEPQRSSKLAGLFILSYERSMTRSHAGHSSIGPKHGPNVNAPHLINLIRPDPNGRTRFLLHSTLIHIELVLIAFYARDPEIVS